MQTVDKKLFSPEGGRIALSANERIAEFLDFAVQVKFAYVNKMNRLRCFMGCSERKGEDKIVMFAATQGELFVI